MRYSCGTLLIFGSFSSVLCFLQLRRSDKSDFRSSDGSDRGNPLILTSLIQQGKIKDARNAAEIKFKDFKDVKSYSGYFGVDDAYNSNLFFWFFPSKIDYENAPVVLWLQGGPGSSSLYGLFVENGPFHINENGGIDLRQHSWAESHSVIYIDNPVGTGFSFTDGGYAQNQTIIGEHLYSALLQFFKMFPELQKNDFYVTGESYAGKYVPAVSYTIHKNNPAATQKINLQGLAMGDGLTDPEHQLVYSDFLYQIGLIDFNVKIEMQKIELKTARLIREKDWRNARLEDVLGLFKAESGFHNVYNFLIPEDILDKDNKILENYLNNPDVKTALHVGNVMFRVLDTNVHSQLDEDMMKSVAPWVSTLLSNYRVMFYNGQLDVCVAYPLTINFLKHLKFSAADEYKVADRHQWYVNSELAGYVKEAGNLTEVLVRKAGHMVPMDQPAWALDMITKFTRNKPLY